MIDGSTGTDTESEGEELENIEDNRRGKKEDAGAGSESLGLQEEELSVIL